MRAVGYQCLACLVAFKLLKVLDKELCKFFGFLVPFGRSAVCVTGVENIGINTRQLGGDCQVEVGDCLGGGIEYGSVKYGVDDAACVAYRDTLAGSPSS